MTTPTTVTTPAPAATEPAPTPAATSQPPAAAPAAQPAAEPAAKAAAAPAAPAPDAKPAPAKATTRASLLGEEAAAPGAPEKAATEVVYELKRSKDSPLEQGAEARIIAEARRMNLSPDAAQSLLDREEATITRFRERQGKEQTEQLRRMAEETRSDPEIGGPRLKQSLAYMDSVLRVHDPSGRAAEKLDASGLGADPDFIRMFVSFYRSTKPDTLAGPSAVAKAPQRRADLMFETVDG